jgi:hypothetical protein
LERAGNAQVAQRLKGTNVKKCVVVYVKGYSIYELGALDDCSHTGMVKQRGDERWPRHLKR